MVRNRQRPVDGDPSDDRPAWMKEPLESDDEGTKDDEGLGPMVGRGSDD